MIRITTKGDFSKFDRYLKDLKDTVESYDLDKYGREGVIALTIATPKDTGLTSKSWGYKIVKNKDRIDIVFNNSNIVNGVPIAIILQYGHATRNGGWIEGRDYINPAIQPIFDNILERAWKEVASL